MKTKILLTGSTGFVGSHFYNDYKNTFDITTIQLRSTPPETINFNNIDCVVHCAALVHQMKGAPDAKYFEVNYELTKKLATAAKNSGIQHFVFMSTAHVFEGSGNIENHNKMFNENSICNPKDAYGESKLAAEQFLFSLQDEHFKVAVLRPPMVYGRGGKGNLNLLAKLIKLCPILPLGYVHNNRSLIHISNLTYFMNLVIAKKASGILLPQDSELISLEKLIRYISLGLNKRNLILPLPTTITNVLKALAPKSSIRLFGTLAFDSTVTNKKLGYKAPLNTEAGIKSTFS